MTPITAAKRDLRVRLNSLRNGMSQQDRLRASDAITLELLALDRYKAARTVMAYMTFGSEFVTDKFIRRALDDSKALVLPRVDRRNSRLELYEVRDLDSELVAGPWGIREPRPDLCLTAVLAEVDFVVVPGLGFTARGDRLGYGRGYYDSLLVHRERRTALIAAAFAIQVVEVIPVGPHDVPVDMVISEVETHCCETHWVG